MNRRSKLLIQVVLLLACSVSATRLAAQLPPSKGAPCVGQKALDFTLPDSSGKPVKLSELLATSPNDTAAVKRSPWVLLVFYRGYW